ncbi:MAG TPA: hypothetical protein QF624_04895 [Dehalococcoidia bacterium]|nr:hypothetical protein [Dehalococcoidia bacterium]
MPKKKTTGGKRRRRDDLPSPHHSVYVVELDRAATKVHESSLPPVYVGMTGLTPEERFANHKRGHKAARVVRRYGVRLLPALYEHLNPVTYEEAARMEGELAEALRVRGHVVFGGH